MKLPTRPASDDEAKTLRGKRVVTRRGKKEGSSLAVVKGKGRSARKEQQEADKPEDKPEESAVDEAEKPESDDAKEETDKEKRENKLQGILQKAIDKVRRDLTPHTTTITRIKNVNTSSDETAETSQATVVSVPQGNAQKSVSQSKVVEPIPQLKRVTAASKAGSSNVHSPGVRTFSAPAEGTPAAGKKKSYTIATPVAIANLKATYPEDKVERGRPINPAVTSITVDEDTGSFLRVTPVKKDIKVISLDMDTQPRRTQPKICQYCGLQFTSIQSLADHQCGEKNLFRCGICSAMFMRKDNLRRHWEEHTDQVQVEVLASD